jgi:hypothetical protein
MDIVDNNIITGDLPTASGTFEFTGSGLVFHKRNSEPFIVTYTIDAVVRPLTKSSQGIRSDTQSQNKTMISNFLTAVAKWMQTC